MKKMLNRFFLPLLGLLFAGTLSVAAASDVKAPDALVKDVTNEVLEIVRADKAIQAGDTKRVIELVGDAGRNQYMRNGSARRA